MQRESLYSFLCTRSYTRITSGMLLSIIGICITLRSITLGLELMIMMLYSFSRQIIESKQ